MGLLSCTTATPEDDMAAPCNDVGQCLPGWICAQGRCVEGDSGSKGPNSVGATGGIVKGPNGVQIEVPTGALSDTIELAWLAHSSALSLPGLVDGSTQALELLAPPIEIGPAATMFSLEATIVMPVDTSSRSLSSRDVAVYHASTIAGPFIKLFGASSSTLAIGLSNGLGVFAPAMVPGN